MRTCIGCRNKKNKSLLLRLAIDSAGLPVLDRRQCLPGRGAYVCSDDSCVAAAFKGRRLAVAFKRPLKGDPESARAEVLTECLK
ncbi:MAG: YlxR family protein [Pseudomonadota bacterium]